MSSSLNIYISTYFGVTDIDQLNYINQLFELKEIPRGEFLLEQEKICDDLAFVENGFMRMHTLVDGNEITQWISGPGHFATELQSFIFDTPSRWNIQAISDTNIFTISKENYQRVCETIPLWNQLEKAFLIKCFTTLENRVLSHLSMSAEERYQNFETYFPDIFRSVPQSYIASLLGMTPETFSRIRKKISK
jgi:CRP-like cAMP-binding protein